MKNFFQNTGYFLKETITLLRLNPLSNLFSILSTGLIFFLFAMTVSGWRASNHVVEVIQGEAEVNVYFQEGLEASGVLQLVEKIKDIQGVREARQVSENEAYERMEEMLGKEARVLEFLEENPFTSFIEVKIHLGEMDGVMETLEGLAGVQQVRDNREVLERIRSLGNGLKALGLLVVAAVGICTLVILSHMIRQGIYSNREQINTLRLLGAPEAFIAFPFLLEGLFLTLGGGGVASGFAALAVKKVYASMAGPLPFIPLPPQESLISGMVLLVLSLSIGLGIAGSLFGFLSAKRE